MRSRFVFFVDRTEASQTLCPHLCLPSPFTDRLHPSTCKASIFKELQPVWSSCGLPVLRLKRNSATTGLEKIGIYTGTTSTNAPVTTSDDKILMWLQSALVKRASYTSCVLLDGQSVVFNLLPAAETLCCAKIDVDIISFTLIFSCLLFPLQSKI